MKYPITYEAFLARFGATLETTSGFTSDEIAAINRRVYGALVDEYPALDEFDDVDAFDKSLVDHLYEQEFARF